MFVLYRNDRKNHFPWQFDEIAADDDFTKTVEKIGEIFNQDNKDRMLLRVEIDYTNNTAIFYTSNYIYLIR